MNIENQPQLPPPSPEDSHSAPLPPPYIPPEAELESIEVNPIDIQEQQLSYSGLKRAVFQKLNEKFSDTIEDVSQSDHIIRSTPSGARRIRGFYSEPEALEDKPRTIVERAASHLRQRQAKRKMRLELERRHLHSSHGGVPEDTIDTSVPEPPKKPVWTIERKYYATAPSVTEGAAALRKKTEDLGRPEASTLGKPPVNEYGEVIDRKHRPKQTRAEKAEIRKDRRLKKALAKIERRMEKGEDGDTLHGKYRRAKSYLLESMRDYARERVDAEDKKLVPIAQREYSKDVQRFLESQPPLETMNPPELQRFYQELGAVHQAGLHRVYRAQVELGTRWSDMITQEEREKLIAQRRKAAFRGAQNNRQLMKTAKGRQVIKRQFNKNGEAGRLPEEDQKR